MQRAGTARVIASLALVAAACHGNTAAPPCTIGQPCEPSGGDNDGLTCVGTPLTDNGQTECACDCYRAPVEAGADADAGNAESGACGAGTTGACNELANTGTTITPTCVAGAAPAMTGGAVADGTYVLVAGTAYASSCAGVTLPSGGPTTLLVSAGCIQSVDVTGGAKTYAWSTGGTTFTMSEVCPAASPPADLQYTATPTTLSQLAQSSPQLGLVSVFQKQ